MKRLSISTFIATLFTLAFSSIAFAAASPITNGSFQTGDFTGWTVYDSTHCRFGLCNDGVASVGHCVPAAPGDTDGYCAVAAGNNVTGAQQGGTTNAHQYTISGCLMHSGIGNGSINGPVSVSASGDTGWVCGSRTYNNPIGATQRYAPISWQGTGGTTYVDQFVFTVNKK